MGKDKKKRRKEEKTNKKKSAQPSLAFISPHTPTPCRRHGITNKEEKAQTTIIRANGIGADQNE